jgi:hypothetical protein
MATQTKTPPRSEYGFAPRVEHGLDEATGRLRDINERVVTASRKAGNATLDSYQRALVSFADLTEKAGHASQNEWIAAAAHTQADLTRELTEAYTSAARTLLR